MPKVLHRHVASEATAQRSVWVAGLLLLAGCTTLVLKALPEFGLVASAGLVAAVALAWVVVGALLPKMVCA